MVGIYKIIFLTIEYMMLIFLNIIRIKLTAVCLFGFEKTRRYARTYIIIISEWLLFRCQRLCLLVTASAFKTQSWFIDRAGKKKKDERERMIRVGGERWWDGGARNCVFYPILSAWRFIVMLNTVHVVLQRRTFCSVDGT